MRYEDRIVHKAVARQLTASGIVFRHECPLPNGDRADFVFFENGEEKVPAGVLEIKPNCRSMRRTIAQVLRYRKQLGNAIEAWIIVPFYTRTNEAIWECKEAGVYLGFVRCDRVEFYRAKMNFKRSLGIPDG